jgi:hypothetical protein
MGILNLFANRLARLIAEEVIRILQERRTAEQPTAATPAVGPANAALADLAEQHTQAREEAGKAAKRAGCRYSDGVQLFLLGVPVSQIEQALKLPKQ